MLVSFKHAFNGFHWLIRSQRNFKIHLLISFIVLLLSYILQVTRGEFIILVFCIILGLVVEMANTSIEEMTNLITIKWAKQAKIAKDVSSAMMLLTSIGLALIGLIIFIPYLFRR